MRDSTKTINAGYLAKRGVTLLPKVPKLEDAVGRASIVVNHASINTVQSCIGAGRPQLLVPIKLDQGYIARNAQEIGLGLTLSAAVTPEAVAAAIRRLAADKSRPRAVIDYAAAVRARGQHDQLPPLDRAL